MRKSSIHSSRASHAGSTASQASSAQLISKLLEKKKEFEAVLALEKASTEFLKRIEGLADDFENLADAGIGTNY